LKVKAGGINTLAVIFCFPGKKVIHEEHEETQREKVKIFVTFVCLRGQFYLVWFRLGSEAASSGLGIEAQKIFATHV